MASISFYDVSVGTYTRALKVLHRILNKASASHADPSLLNARLAPDSKQLFQDPEFPPPSPLFPREEDESS